NREAQAHRDTMSEMFDTQYEAGFNGNGPDPSVPEHADDAWGLLYVPRFGADYSVPVLDGTGEEINSAVLGRYSTSPRPGQDGNLALAGHRQTYGAVVWEMDHVRDGERRCFQAAIGWRVYDAGKVPVVVASDPDVLHPNPIDPATAEPRGQWPTLTTCLPPHTVLQRMNPHAESVQ